MPTPFLSSEEYDERAHQLYNEGQYDDALEVLHEGLALYPNSVELHVGEGYARLAREEYAWARRTFERALVLEPEHEDGLAGLGETLLKLGQEDPALRCFRRVLELGYEDDVDLMLQAGRSLFREGSLRDRRELFLEARAFFETAIQQAPESAEAVACLGYVQHRLNEDDAAIVSLKQALQLDGDHAEARIYLANILYDRAEYEGALYHFERTGPEDHWDELGIWRLVELKRAVYKLEENDPELRPWEDRVAELAGELDDIDALLMDLDIPDGADPGTARGQLELFGSLLNTLQEQRQPEPEAEGTPHPLSIHSIVDREGVEFDGSWEDIVTHMRDARREERGSTLEEFMKHAARRWFRETGVHIPSHDPESFLRAGARAGLIRIVK